jgi:hypothetical protein
MIIATGEHDNGWWEYDLRPLVSDKGEPINFIHVSRELHMKFYKRGIERVTDQDEYAGLMDVMHNIGLFNRRYGTDTGPVAPPYLMDDPRYKDFLQTMENTRKELVRNLQNSKEFKEFSTDQLIWTNYKLLEVFDRLAIHYCFVDEPSDGSVFPVPSKEVKGKTDNDVKINISKTEGNTYSFNPYPFDKNPLTVTVRARYVSDRKYSDNDDFRKELSKEERRMIEYKLTSANPKIL